MRKGERETGDREFYEGAARTALESLVSDNHLSDEELDAVIDDGVNHPHVAVCTMCRAEVEDLRRFEEGQGEGRLLRESNSNWWLIAASVALAVLALSSITLILRRDPVPATATKPSASVAPAPVAPPPPAVVASVTDGTDRIALLDDGTIA